MASMTMSRRGDTLSTWLRQVILGMRSDGDKCNRLVIKHFSVGGRGSEIMTFGVRMEEMDEPGLKILQQQLLDTMHNDADAIGDAIQKYEIRAYSPTEDKHFSRHVYKVQVQRDEDDEDSLSSEPANKTGLLAQTMRHQEATMRTSLAAVTAVMTQMARALERVSRQNEELMDKHFEIIKTSEELFEEKHRRELETKRQEKQFQIRGEAIETIKAIAPTIINKIAGRNLLPEADTSLNKVIEEFMSEMDMAKLEALQAILTPKQFMTILHIVEDIQNRNEAKAKATSGDKNGVVS